MDTSGRIHILGRRDDVIVRAGQKIHPAEIADCIAEIDGVQECAVVGGRKKSGDETIVAHVCSGGIRAAAVDCGRWRGCLVALGVGRDVSPLRQEPEHEQRLADEGEGGDVG